MDIPVDEEVLRRVLEDVNLLAKAMKKKPKGKRSPFLYVIDEGKYFEQQQEWMGQRYLVIRAMLELGAKGDAGKSALEITNNVKPSPETNAPNRNAVGQIINKLKEAGIVTCLNPQNAKKKGKSTTPAPKPIKTA